MRVTILGCGGGAPSGRRETSCVIVRDGERALLIDCGTGARRLLSDPAHLEGIEHLDIVLTHFHLDHVCGLPYLRLLGISAAIWVPGAWLYSSPASAAILEPLQRPPIAPTHVSAVYPVNELREGEQLIAGFVRASAQPRHWAPTAGVCVEAELAVITDTPYEETSARLAAGVVHLLHEAWSSSSSPITPSETRRPPTPAVWPARP